MPPASRAPRVGLVCALLLATAAMLVPAVTGWDVHVNSFPPLHAIWDPRVGPGTVPAIVVGALASWWAIPLAQRLSWGRLLLATYAAGLAWMFSLAFVDGPAGIGRVLDGSYEYLNTARATHDLPRTLHEYVSRIPFDAPLGHWPPHVAGHPPGALTFFVLLVRLGLGSGFAAGTVVTLIAGTTALAVMVTLRTLGAERLARRAAPFLVFAPAAVWQAVSADAMFAAVAAWGTAALALGAVRRTPRGGGAWSPGWSLLAGLLLGYAVMMSYGLPLLGVLAVAVLVLARNPRPLPVAALAALAVVLAFGAFGYDYLQALPVIHRRYWDGVARVRPARYWLWGDLAALVFSAGPLVGAGVACLRASRDRVARWLSGAGVAMVLLADASLMSKAEVERIWLPFVPWLLVSCALLPLRWRRIGLVLQVVVALVVQHLLDTGW